MSRPLKSTLSRSWQFVNIQTIFVTFDVLRLLRFSFIKSSQPANMLCILTTFDVSSPLRSNCFMEQQSANIHIISLTFDVSNLSKSIDSTFINPPNMVYSCLAIFHPSTFSGRNTVPSATRIDITSSLLIPAFSSQSGHNVPPSE